MFENKTEGFWERVQGFYWTWWPASLRPSELWYNLKCTLWYRYRTVKPRTLKGQGWCDKTTLIPHCLFELLTQFWEQEVHGHVDWEASGHTIDVDGFETNVYDVWKRCYEWWPKYLNLCDTCHNEWHEFHEKHSKNVYTSVKNELYPGDHVSWTVEWDTKENELEGDRLFREANKIEADLEKELVEHMVLIVRTYRYMWT